MLYKFLIFSILFGLNCNAQTSNLIGKTLIGNVGSMCIEVTSGCAGESYFLELTIKEKSIFIRQKTEEIVTCNTDNITYKNLGDYQWKASKETILIQNKSSNSNYKLISLKRIENQIIGNVDIYGEIKEIVFRELNKKN